MLAKITAAVVNQSRQLRRWQSNCRKETQVNKNNEWKGFWIFLIMIIIVG